MGFPFLSIEMHDGNDVDKAFLVVPNPKADIWILVSSGNLTLISLVSHFLCRSAGGIYGMGGRTDKVPFSNSKFFNPSGGDLRLELMAPCQSRVSKIRHLNTDLGGTCKIPKEDTWETSLTAKS